MHRFFILSLLVLFSMSSAEARFSWLPWVSSERTTYGQIEEQNRNAAPLFEEAEAARAEGKNRSARRTYERLAKRYPGSRYAAPALYEAGHLQLERGNSKRAFDNFQQIIDNYPGFEKFDEVISTQFEIASGLKDQGSRRVLGVFPATTERDAIQFYESVVRNAPYSDYAPIALMNVAMLHTNRGETEDAIDALDRLINDYPRSFLASDAYLLLGQNFASLVNGPYYDQGATSEAISYYRDYLILYPDSPDAEYALQGLAENEDMLARSRLLLGEYYLRYHRNEEAGRVLLNETITLSPESPSADRAREIIAMLDESPDSYGVRRENVATNFINWLQDKAVIIPQAEPMDEVNRPEDDTTVASSIQAQREREEKTEEKEERRGLFDFLRRRPASGEATTPGGTQNN